MSKNINFSPVHISDIACLHLSEEKTMNVKNTLNYLNFFLSFSSKFLYPLLPILRQTYIKSKLENTFQQTTVFLILIAILVFNKLL